MTITALTGKINETAKNQENKKALLVIDVQENLLNADSRLHMDPGAVYSFTKKLNETIEFFHVNRLPVIYTLNEWRNPVLNLLTGNVCKKGGKGTGIDKTVNVVNKNIYSKSKMNALSNQQLSIFLKENSISELYITGLFAEACIKGTARGALKNNYKAVVVEDAVGSKNKKKKLASLLYCERQGANIITTDELFNHSNNESNVSNRHANQEK